MTDAPVDPVDDDAAAEPDDLDPFYALDPIDADDQDEEADNA